MILCPSYIKLQFDISKYDDFQDKIYIILWSCISYEHVRDQFFNKKIKNLKYLIKESQPKTYQDFKKLIFSTGLSEFGKDCIDKGTYFRSPTYKLSDNFWSQIWRYLKKYLENNTNQTSLNLFKKEILTIETIDKLFFL